jgi:BirA family biotin operon repressor/biotin-[acetyl-CoA-carboxylase] ligase
MFDTLFTGKNFVELAETASTNSYAMRLLVQSPPEGTVVSTTYQSQGRGQSGNYWESQAGKNLTLSIIYYPDFLAVSDLFYLSKMVSVALHSYIAGILHEETVRIKWPNDILVNGQKIAGILIENQLEGPRVRVSVSGIGLNVNQRDFSPLISARTCSIRHFKSTDLDLRAVMAGLLQQVERAYLQLRAGELDVLDRMYLSHLYGYHKKMNFRIGDKLVSGTIIGVEKQGKLAVELSGGLRYFDLKEIEFIIS